MPNFEVVTLLLTTHPPYEHCVICEGPLTCSNFFDVVTKFAQKEICQSSLSFPFFLYLSFPLHVFVGRGKVTQGIYTQQAQNILLKMLGVPQHGLAFVKVPLPTSLERKSPMQPLLPRCGSSRVVPLPPPLLVSKK